VTQNSSVGADTHVRIAILGAGPTGIGAAWRLSQHFPSAPDGSEQDPKHDSHSLPFLLLDESPTPGGRAASFTTPEGFTFDYGGHVLFPHAEYAEFSALLDQVVPQWHASTPIRGVWMANKLIPTPVQRNIHRLPLATMAACLWGLSRRSPLNGAVADPTLHAYLESQFGKSLTRHVMGPLNRKMWAHDPRALGSAWSSRRSGSTEKNIPEVSVRRVLRNLLLNRDDVGWTPSTVVRYPRQGGMGAIWDAIFALLPSGNTRLGARVVEVDADAKTLRLADGSTIEYQRLVSTIPLDLLLRMMTGQPTLQARAKEFRPASVQLFGFGLRGAMPPMLKGVHAINVPSPDIPFWRINIPSNFSPGNVPDPESAWSILCECSIPPGSGLRYSKEQIEVALRQMGLVPPSAKVVSVFSAEIEHGYPVPFAGRDELLNEVQPQLEQLDIYSRGRFGGWRYEVSNQDHAFMQGVEIIDRLRDNKPEYTYLKTW
jgi:protoporphyrinogen oxidase